MEEETSKLHIVMLPWLAMGHLIPFFELSKRLALKGLQISFFSTPSNIHRLPSVPQTLSPFLNFIPCSVPSMNNLPSSIENTIDLHSEAERPLLNQTYAGFEQHLIAFLSDSSRPKTDWVIYDFAGESWVPALASRFNVNSAFFCLFNAAAVSFLDRTIDCDSPEKLTKVPDGIPFPTTVAFLPFEARQIYSTPPKKTDQTESKPQSSQLIPIRTCKEFETKWVDLLSDKYCPVGFLPPSFDEEEGTETWARIREWLDEREDFSVIYAAFGSEAKLTGEQIDEIGLGLEQCGLPFVWALRVGSPPQGFEERTAGRGLVWMGWVPQARLLAHPAVGGFLTHGGWNSAVEGMAVGAAMVVLPMMFEQGLNARHLVETGYAVEVVRNDEDGYFSGEEIGRKLRMVMVEEEGEELRKKARMGKEIFGSGKLQEEYVVELVKKLREKGKTVAKTRLICNVRLPFLFFSGLLGQFGSASSPESQQQNSGNAQFYGASQQSETSTGSYASFSSFRFGSVPMGQYALQVSSSQRKTNSSSSPLGLPLRPGEPLCIFYSRYGICKFGPNCKFDHPMAAPMGILAYSLSASSSSDVPVVRRLLGGSSSAIPALTFSSDGPLEASHGKSRRLPLSDSPQMDSGDENVESE